MDKFENGTPLCFFIEKHAKLINEPGYSKNVLQGEKMVSPPFRIYVRYDQTVWDEYPPNMYFHPRKRIMVIPYILFEILHREVGFHANFHILRWVLNIFRHSWDKKNVFWKREVTWICILDRSGVATYDLIKCYKNYIQKIWTTLVDQVLTNCCLNQCIILSPGGIGFWPKKSWKFDFFKSLQTLTTWYGASKDHIYSPFAPSERFCHHWETRRENRQK